MTNYDKLVAALRYHADTTNCDACKLYDAGKCELKSCVLHDAADAIEAMQAEKKKTVTQIFGEEQQEWEEYCTGLMNRIRELKAQMPKRGEWINSKERMRPDMCSVCGCVYEADRFMDKIAWNYCPRCGAKMEVQDG